MKTEFSIKQGTRQTVACPTHLEGEPRRHEDFFELSSDGYLITDASGTIQDANHAATVLLNMARGALVGKPMIGFAVEADRNTFFAQLGGLLRMPALQEWEVRLQRLGGTPFPAAITATPVRNSAGHLVSLLWILHDITERWLAEEALRESNDLLSKLIQYSHDAVFIVDPAKDKILDVNPKACAVLEYSRKELLSLPVSDVVSAEKCGVRGFVDSVFEQGYGKTDRLAFVTRSGRALPSEASAASIDLAGTSCVLVMVRDRRGCQPPDALGGRKTLEGLLPMCAACKKIRDDKGSWHHLESYIADHTDAQFTHGLCPDCVPGYFPSLGGQAPLEGGRNEEGGQ